MLVSRTNFGEVIAALTRPGIKSLDTETTGLRAYQQDEAFSIIIADEIEVYYFNFILYPSFFELENRDEYWLSREEHWPLLLGRVLMRHDIAWVMHNAKFDLRMLAQWGLTDIPGKVHCSMAIGRVVNNTLMSYSLANLTKGSQEGKSDAVKNYISKHKCYKIKPVMWKKEPEKLPQYHRVPLDVIRPYAETDARITRQLGIAQYQVLCEQDASRRESHASILQVVENERALTKMLFRMEHIGIKIDRQYCLTAYTKQKEIAGKAEGEIARIIGGPFVDSGKALADAFGKAGIQLPKVRKAAPGGKMIETNEFATDEATLRSIDHPLGQHILTYREAHKSAYTYFANFMDLADRFDVIHADFKQSGTTTGRMSCADPNLQNLTKMDEDEPTQQIELFPVRRAFVPRKDFCFVKIDYEQQEYRLMLDYAAQLDVIQEVINGLDVHRATAKMMDVSRQHAKTINFMLLYGGGAGKLATALKISIEEAQELRKAYFAKLPRIAEFVQAVQRKARENGYITNWFGRRCWYPDPDLTYMAPNHLIQGGCGDITKIALVRCDDWLRHNKCLSRIVLTVHDEIDLEVHKKELDIVPHIMKIMCEAYPHRYLPMAVDASYSWENLQDIKKGLPAA